MNNNIIKVQIHQLLQYLFKLNIYCNQQIFNRLYLPANSVLLERERAHTHLNKSLNRFSDGLKNTKNIQKTERYGLSPVTLIFLSFVISS